jgi:Glycosyl transferases group 1
MIFKETRIAFSRWQVAGRNLARALRDNLVNTVARRVIPSRPRPPAQQDASRPAGKPVIFASYAADADLTGSHRYCGGEKLLNNLILLLRRHGYEAFMVSYDGKNSQWLAEHAPFLSVEQFRERVQNTPDPRCITSWIKARAFLDRCGKFYFWDQELGASARSHFPVLARMMGEGRIVRTAGVNRTVQAWHRAVFEQEAAILRQLVDEKYWKPDESRRQRLRVGYFDEGEHGAEYIRRICERTAASGLTLDFFRLQGAEPEIISQMQTCAVFLALNIGKSPLWGEGGPMTPQEAMACGTVPVCFDLNGPWEFIQQGYNGIIPTEITPELMADAVMEIYQSPGRLEEMSRRCLEMTRASHTMEARWPDVRKFLNLPE